MGPAPTLIQTAVDELPAALRSLVSAHLSRLGKPYDENDWVTAPEPGWTSLPKVLAGSDFIARTLASQPQLLTQLTSPGTIARSRQPGELRRQIEAISGDREYVASTLRQLRQQEIVRIGWRDLAGLAPLSEVLRTLSELADAAIDCALTCAHNEVRERYGEPIGAQSGEPVQLTILALGKLGGQELNLSSDVDLVFAYRESGQTDGPKSISNHEFFIKVGQILIAILESPSAAGIVFRTDMRLRPNGDSGPLALSFDAMDHYFVTHGRDWERYALIKARPVAGDVGAGVTLLDNLRPFVYRKYLDFGAFEAIRKMKALIERQLIRQNLKDNVKLGRGGIREIEFAVQSHQLIYGGRNPDLQTPSFYTALAALENAGVFEPDECQMLRDHYGFLRALEHRLQIMDDAQTHTVPINSLDRERIALSIGCNSTQDFNSKLTTVNNSVHELFRAVFRQDGPGEDEDSDSMAGDLWHATVDTKTGIAQLATLGFTETERVHRLLANTRRSRFYQSFSREGRERLDKLMPAVLRVCGQADNPDTAITRLLFVIESIGRRSAYLALLGENPLALKQLVRLVGASSEISHWIGKHPVILDELLDPIAGFQLQDHHAIEVELRRKLDRCDQSDLEVVMDQLREYRQGYSLRVAAADIAQLIDIDVVSKSLSALAQALLCQALTHAVSTLDQVSAPDQVPDLGIIAYGKLGSMELGYNSDLDIVFVYDQPSDENAARAGERRHYFGRLARRLAHILTTRTAAGEVYAIDTRLRPSGRSGTLVTPLPAYHEYLRDTAWTWEHQALVRARLVAGSETLKSRFETVRRDILCQPRDATTLQETVRNMRQRMRDNRPATKEPGVDFKHGTGGLVDIEFLCQYLVLRHAATDPELTTFRTNAAIIKRLADTQKIEIGEADTLAQVLRLYLAQEHALKLSRRPALVGVGEYAVERKAISGLWRKYLDPKQRDG